MSLSVSQKNYTSVQNSLQKLASLFQPGEPLDDRTISSLMHCLNRSVQIALPKKDASTFFASFPREIWGRITDFLSLKDIGRFSQVVAKIDKKQNERVHHIENRSIDLIKSSGKEKRGKVLLFSAARGNINLFNELKEIVHEDLLEKSFVLAAKKNQLKIMQAVDKILKINTPIIREAYLLAAHHRAKEVTQYLESRDLQIRLPGMYRYMAFSKAVQSNEIRGFDLSLIQTKKLIEALYYASTLGNDQVIDTLIQDPSFNKISNEAIEIALADAAKEDRLICFELLFNCGRINDLDIEMVSEALSYAAANGNEEMVQIIMNSPRFNEIPPKFLGEALSYTAEFDSQNILDLLLKCGRFNEISKNALNKALKSAAQANHYRIVIALIECQRFHEINKNILESALLHACIFGSLKILDALMYSGRFSDISQKCLSQSFEYVVRKENVRILQKLMTSDRLHEILPEYHKRALRYAAGNGFEEIVKILMKPPFNEFDLASAISPAVKNGQSKTVSLLAKHSLKMHTAAILHSIAFNQKEILDHLKNSPYFQDVSPKHLGNALKIGVEHDHHPVLQSLIESSRFQEIPVDYLASALIDANKKKYEIVIEMLIESERYDESTLSQMSPNTRETISAILQKYDLPIKESPKKRRKTSSY